MPQTLVQLLQPMLEAVVEEIDVTDMAVVLPEAQATSPHLLVKVGRLTAPGWQALLQHESACLLRVPLAPPGTAGQPAWLCLYRPGASQWSAEQRLVGRVLAQAIARMMGSYGGAVDWRQLIASRRILAVNEEELCRLVLDIHDGPVQKLFAALNLLDHTQSVTARTAAPAVGQELQRVTHILEAAMREIRTFLGAFHPPEFAQRDLLDMVEGLVIQHEEFTSTSVQIEASPDLPPVAAPVKIALYRILQEALANVYRHAGVNECFVHLWAQRGRVHLEVIDHGRGFTPPPLDGPYATEAVQHIGLRGMRDRVHLVNGTLWVTSALGQGTTVHVEVPVDG
jgi:signal transduction histidine kinase